MVFALSPDFSHVFPLFFHGFTTFPGPSAAHGHVFQAPALPGAALHGLLRGQQQAARPGAQGAQHGVQRGGLKAQGVGFVPWEDPGRRGELRGKPW